MKHKLRDDIRHLLGTFTLFALAYIAAMIIGFALDQVFNR
mgnify:CR=1 FL=1